MIKLTGMGACENSGIVPDSARSHAVVLHGVFHGNLPVYSRAAFMLADGKGVTLKIAVRCSDVSVSQLIVSAIR